MNTLLYLAILCQPPDVFGGEIRLVRPHGQAFQQSCPDGNCPLIRGAARVVAAPVVIPSRAVARQVKIAAAPKSLVEIHNELHNGRPGGPHWTWPGDLAEHLRVAHGVQLATITQAKQQPTPAPLWTRPPEAACPGGVCPVQRPQRSVLRWRRR